MLDRIKQAITPPITDRWADLVTDGKDAEYRRIRDTDGQQAADAWLEGQDRNTRKIAKRDRIPDA